MKNKEQNNANKKIMIEKLIHAIQEIGKELNENDLSLPEEKLPQADVLLDTMHFLNNYDENVKVLNQYWLNKRKEEKLNITYIEEMEK